MTWIAITAEQPEISANCNVEGAAGVRSTLPVCVANEGVSVTVSRPYQFATPTESPGSRTRLQSDWRES